MKKILFPLFFFLIYSCTPGPEVTEEQRLHFEECRKLLLGHKEAFISSGNTAGKKDSLRDYISDLEKNTLDQLLEKYEVPQEQLVGFLYSVCEKADRYYEGPSMEDVILSADSLRRMMDSMIRADSSTRERQLKN
ncbi:MAG: hypothetical protein M3R17_08785 [Bacteroidota bacterium]|nr:hypothetical protein [Bacteroidota bacterium]